MKGTCSLTSTASAPSSRRSSGPQPFDFQPLGRVVFEPGALARLGELTPPLGGTRVLLVTDPGLGDAGRPQRAEASLRAAGLDAFTFDGVKENRPERQVADGVAFARPHASAVIVAGGGGSSMDRATGVNVGLRNGRRMADYQGFGKAARPMLPSIGVPTTAGTGSEAQSYALIADESSHLKMACGDKKAAFRIAVLDPEVTLTQPKTVTAVTGIDSVAHAVESYVCTRRNVLSQTFARQAWNLLNANFERVLRDPEGLAARADMQLGAHLAGMAIEASMLGCAHACANPLTAHYGVTHGIAVGVMLPHVVRYNAAAADAMYADLMPGGAEAVAARLTALLRAADLPTTLAECGVSRDILPLLAVEANEQWTARFNPRPVTEADLRRLYEAAG
jgi:alcohol dehydrogenase